MLKKMIFSILAVAAFFTIHQTSFAGTGTFGYIEGTIVSWDQQNVKLALENGKHVSVKRASIPKYYKLNEGSKVVAYFGQKEFLAAATKKAKK